MSAAIRPMTGLDKAHSYYFFFFSVWQSQPPLSVQERFDQTDVMTRICVMTKSLHMVGEIWA